MFIVTTNYTINAINKQLIDRLNILFYYIKVTCLIF